MSLSYFILSGEHPSLPFSELKSVCGLYGVNIDWILIDGRIAVGYSPKAVHHEVCMRAAYVKEAGLAFSIEALQPGRAPKIGIQEDLLQVVGDKTASFKTEAIKLGGAKANRVELEKAFSDQVLCSLKNLKISLEKPDIVFTCIVTPSTLVTGLRLAQKPIHYFTGRRAGMRPFKIPSALQPKLARCMVNMAVKTLQDTVLDPFAGSGSIPLEAVLMNHPAVGMELKTWITNGMLANIRHYDGGWEMVVQGDARHPPFREGFDAIVTDPPYGRSSTIPGKSLSRLLEDFLNTSLQLLRRGGKICITLPSEPEDLIDLEGLGLKILEKHTVYIHKNLTRFLVVMSR
ncbi:hypothetical protein HRbin01_00430 [archaeon HR01]|nr:hypothetical protein HRbin01_00430 [archaeon HR01]